MAALKANGDMLHVYDVAHVYGQIKGTKRLFFAQCNGKFRYLNESEKQWFHSDLTKSFACSHPAVSSVSEGVRSCWGSILCIGRRWKHVMSARRSAC